MKTREYKVAARSCTRNSFGLRGHVLVDRWGTAYEVAFNDQNAPGVMGDSIHVLIVGASPAWSRVGGEIPRALPKTPEKIVRRLWQRRAFRTPRILQLNWNGDPYGGGFDASESEDEAAQKILDRFDK